jgi:hypothetical protein
MTLALTPLTAADLGLPSPRAVSAALPLFVVAVLMAKRWLPRVAACFALVAGATLTSGWLYDGIHRLLGWATTAIDKVTETTVGGVVPGAVAIIMLIYFVLEVRPDPAALGRLAGLRDIRGLRDVRYLVGAGSGGGRAGGGRYRGGYYSDGESSGRRGRVPDKLGAAGVGLALPAVVATIPGDLGAIALSVTNVVGGLFTLPVAHAFGTV